MALRPSLSVRPCRAKWRTGKARYIYAPCVSTRNYAVVGSTTYVGEPPSPPSPPPTEQPPSSSFKPPDASTAFDARVLYELRRHATPPGSEDRLHDLPELILQYLDRSERVLDVGLPYESRPSADRRTPFDSNASEENHTVAMVVHAAQSGEEHKITHCSGFAINAPGMSEGEAVFVTCAHTLEEIRHSPVLNAIPKPHVSGSLLVSGDASSPTFSPVSAVLSALHRSDLVLLSATAPANLRTLPVSPYPAHPGTPIRAHFVCEAPPTSTSDADADGWTPWVGGTWSKWVRGTVVEYRDSAGREAKPGSYDALAHLHFDPPPTPGSSGGPIVDEESGAVIGVMLGTQLQNRVEGVRGWGVPAEMIFEMFRLPGLKLKRQ